MAALGIFFLGESSLILGSLGTLFFAAPVIVALWLGRVAMRSTTRGQFLTLGLGWILLAVLFLIPFVGGIAKLLVAVLGLGAVVAWAIETARS
jgi:hypothetical protein